MDSSDYSKLCGDLDEQLLGGAKAVGILGLTDVALKLLKHLSACGLVDLVVGVYDPLAYDISFSSGIRVEGLGELAQASLDVLVVASDAEKQDLLLAAIPYIVGAPKVIVAGYAHLEFRDAQFRDEVARLLVPSLANGYPASLIHIYQCLVNASRLGLTGTVAEFGMFKGGTTMFISRTIERLGEAWPVIGFDTFSGFPPRRSPLDMYAHPDCIFTDIDAVRRYLYGRDVQIVPGDIVATAKRLAHEDLVLSFIDTDNYSSAQAAVNVAQERTVTGGSIVFDHFTGVDRFRYTLGERMAGLPLLEDSRYLHLHGTGVFYRQR